MENRENVCVLMSGGIDSAVLLAESLQTADRVLPVFVRFGLVWERSEIYWLERLLQTEAQERLERLEVLELPVGDLYGPHWSLTGIATPDRTSPDAAVYLPGRNVLLLAKAGVLAASRDFGTVLHGALSGNPFPDATPEFFAAMGRALGLGTGRNRPLEVRAPLLGARKTDVIERAVELGLRLDLTFSCLSPDADHRHCGMCNKCAERRRGFDACGVDDPTTYAAPDGPPSDFRR